MRLEQLVDPLPLVPRFGARTASPNDAASAFSASSRLSSTRVPVEHGRLLELAADAELGDRGLVEAGEVVVPSKQHVAFVGRVLPVMTSIIVVLPAPFGPMMARISPWSMASERPLSARKPSKRDGDVVEVEQGRRDRAVVHRPTPPAAASVGGRRR